MEHKAYEILAKLAIEHRLDVNKEEDLRKLLSIFENRIKGLAKSAIFVYGKRCENAFFELVKALDSIKFIKEEDTGRIKSNFDIKVPDYRMVTKDEASFLV